MIISGSTENQPSYSLNEKGCFVIENYNQSKAFSNFFPGVAGLWGIPMWVFFVNRVQCISSFGIESKDKAITEFHPANKAYRLTALQGFRTFLKITSGNKLYFWEPFQENALHNSFNSKQNMYITAHDLTIEDVNKTLGLTVRVNYFTVPNASYPALYRRVTIENTSKKTCQIEALDGLPLLLPYGTSDWVIKNISRTVEAWVKVRNVENKAPFFQLNVEVSDTPDVRHIKEGHFYFSYEPEKAKGGLLDVIVDTAQIFGPCVDFISPDKFLEAKKYKMPAKQQTSNRTPCAMTLFRWHLSPKKKKTMATLIGYAHSEQQLKKIITRATKKGYIDEMATANQDVIDKLKNFAFTHSSSPEFDMYCGQNFMDNVLRGGLPVSLKTKDERTVFNVFSRKHGDLERDYNFFLLSPTAFSQGNGNYRDVNQNRRNDIWFNQDVKDNAVINFLSLSQADGYNPLVVKGMSFSLAGPDKIDAILKECVKGDAALIKEMLQTGFQPGELVKLVTENGISLKVVREKFLGKILDVCHKQELADHGEGFWSDHWTYNLDLIESYLSVYPDQLENILLKKNVFTFYHNSHYVLPRSRRYLLTGKGVRQYHSVFDGSKEIKAHQKGNKLRVEGGTGEILYVSLLCKLLCLVSNKAATLDPSGIGIEMEADKPNWYDALNGLPGLLGSSLSETFELKRLCQFLLKSLTAVESHKRDMKVFVELATFIRDLSVVLQEEKEPVTYWHNANDVKEKYRESVRLGVTGEDAILSRHEIEEFLNLIILRIDHGVQSAKDSQGNLPTYFYHDVVDYALLDKTDGEFNYVLPVKFRRHTLPLFLEGFVHALRTEDDPQKAKELHELVCRSPLYDKKLKMFKVNADLSHASEEIGRTRIFPRGWLENESIWLHMEYKYMLEILRTGQYKEFFKYFKSALVPFQEPQRYGRSILENSSFLVSSAHEDTDLHGQGFVARLSGSTAEFVHIWLVMNLGMNPYVLNVQKKTCLSLKPILPAWLFSERAAKVRFITHQDKWKEYALPKNSYAFNLSNGTLVVYHNPKRRDTYEGGGLIPKEILLTYANQNTEKVTSAIIPPGLTKDIRDGEVERIDLYYS